MVFIRRSDGQISIAENTQFVVPIISIKAPSWFPDAIVAIFDRYTSQVGLQKSVRWPNLTWLRGRQLHTDQNQDLQELVDYQQYLDTQLNKRLKKYALAKIKVRRVVKAVRAAQFKGVQDFRIIQYRMQRNEVIRCAGDVKIILKGLKCLGKILRRSKQGWGYLWGSVCRILGSLLVQEKASGKFIQTCCGEWVSVSNPLLRTLICTLVILYQPHYTHF